MNRNLKSAIIIVAAIISVSLSSLVSYDIGFWYYQGFPLPWASGANEGVIYPGTKGLSSNVDLLSLIIDVVFYLLLFWIIFLIWEKVISKRKY